MQWVQEATTDSPGLNVLNTRANLSAGLHGTIPCVKTHTQSLIPRGSTRKSSRRTHTQLYYTPLDMVSYRSATLLGRDVQRCARNGNLRSIGVQQGLHKTPYEREALHMGHGQYGRCARRRERGGRRTPPKSFNAPRKVQKSNRLASRHRRSHIDSVARI